MRRIATGGMGEVYEVIHLETERRRALKVMHPHILYTDGIRERFQREARVAAHIESEFIVDVFDAGIDDATELPFMVMELLRGEDLSKRLKRVKRFSPAEAVTYLHQTARALDKTHRASIVHRDLKPDNLFLTEREEGPPTIKVLDFGIAKIMVEGTTSGATQMIGTPTYMAPEQFNSHARITGAADIFSLGMVAYTLLVGAPYWAAELRGGNLYALAAVAIHGPKEQASARAAAKGVALPPAFDAWFQRVTAAKPEHRFATATEAVRALAEALGLSEQGRSAKLERSGMEHVSLFSARDSAIPLRDASLTHGDDLPFASTLRPQVASYASPPAPAWERTAAAHGAVPLTTPSSGLLNTSGTASPSLLAGISAPTNPTALEASLSNRMPRRRGGGMRLGATLALAFAVVSLGVTFAGVAAWQPESDVEAPSLSSASASAPAATASEHAVEASPPGTLVVEPAVSAGIPAASAPDSPAPAQSGAPVEPSDGEGAAAALHGATPPVDAKPPRAAAGKKQPASKKPVAIDLPRKNAGEKGGFTRE